jgi:acyl carrier protein
MLIELDDVRRTVGLVLGRHDPNADDRLVEDLGGESIDLLNIVVTLEEKYGVSIDEAATGGVSTVRDLYDLVLKSPHDRMPSTDPGRPA